jgi:hypothetical protein
LTAQRAPNLASGTSRPGSETFEHKCGPSNRRDCNTGKVLATSKCDEDAVVKANVQTIENGREYKFVVSAGNPHLAGAPAIDFDVTATERWESGRVTFSISGKVDSFPAFEGYVRVREETKRLFTVGPAPGAGPGSLFGGPNRNISGSVSFSF